MTAFLDNLPEGIRRQLDRRIADALVDGGFRDLPEDLQAYAEGGDGAGQPSASESPIVSIGDYRQSVPDDVLWIAKPLVYAGGTTLLSGPPKKGKSTLAAQLFRLRETGGEFLGEDVWTGPCLLLTEESGVAVTWKTDGLERLDVLDRRTAVQAELTWPDVLKVAQDWADTHGTDERQRHKAPLVVIDTLAIWAGIEDENSASDVTQALAPVMVMAANTGAAILLVHHARKGGGTGGEAIRGSGAMLATVDLAAELSVISEGSDDRWLDVQGRVIFPERFRLSFDRETGLYSAEDRRDVQRSELAEMVALVPTDGDGWTRATLREYWAVKDTRDREAKLGKAGLLRSAFEEGKGWRFWRVAERWERPREADHD